MILSVNIAYLQIAHLMIWLSLSIFILIRLTRVNLDAKTVDLSIDTFCRESAVREASFQLLKLVIF